MCWDVRPWAGAAAGATVDAALVALAAAARDQEHVPASPVDELSRLAGMLDTGLLARDEFDHLKARLIGTQ